MTKVELFNKFLEDNDLQAGEKFYILGEDGEELNGKLENEGKYLYGQYNSIK